jgi:hypothetical protein
MLAPRELVDTAFEFVPSIAVQKLNGLQIIESRVWTVKKSDQTARRSKDIAATATIPKPHQAREEVVEVLVELDANFTLVWH